MKTTSRIFFCGIVLLLAALASSAVAQMTAEKVAAIDKNLQAFKTSYDKLPETTKEVMDVPSRMAHLAGVWHRMGMRMTDPKFLRSFQRPAPSPVSPDKALSSSLVPVSAAAITTDLEYSVLGGFTQSETSSARCGSNIVVGFNDSGSIFETPLFFTGSGGESISGYAYSSDGGKTFHDGGPLDPGPVLGNFLGGDPVVTCSDANTFHYSQISADPLGDTISLSTSTDGGETFGPPVTLVTKDRFSHFLDKSWSAVDPTNPKNIYVSYTDFDQSGTSPTCGNFYRVAIELVQSTDGGNTWSAPIVVRQVCGSTGNPFNIGVQGSQLGVDAQGTLYISWVNLGNNFPAGPRFIELAVYAKGQLSSPMTVSAVTPPGDGFFLQGEFRDFLDMSMTVAHSSDPGLDGTILWVWSDGSDKEVPDVLASQGFYGYSDVFLMEGAANVQGGNLLYGPFKVNRDIQPAFGLGHDHYQPSIAVDGTNTYPYVYGVCWYDRRADSENFAVGRYCSKVQESVSGLSFSEMNTGVTPFAPAHDNDEFINPEYMGDYDALSSDFLNQNPGFFSTFQVQDNHGNPNVVAFHF